jgi:alpha-glucosidase
VFFSLFDDSNQKLAKNSSIGMYSGSSVNLGGALETGSFQRLQCSRIFSTTTGWFTLNGLSKARPKVFKPVYSTVVAEAARVLIVFTGLAIIPDTPESYESKADLFEFIARLPMNWDETKIINGKIGKYITTARRSGNTWYIASCCDEQGAQLPINLDFLEAGKQYSAKLFEDAADSHYKTNMESYSVRSIKVSKSDTITAKLAPGGGHCMIIETMKE